MNVLVLKQYNKPCVKDSYELVDCIPYLLSRYICKRSFSTTKINISLTPQRVCQPLRTREEYIFRHHNELIDRQTDRQ